MGTTIDEPLLFHTGLRALFPLVSEAVARVSADVSVQCLWAAQQCATLVPERGVDRLSENEANAGQSNLAVPAASYQGEVTNARTDDRRSGRRLRPVRIARRR